MLRLVTLIVGYAIKTVGRNLLHNIGILVDPVIVSKEGKYFMEIKPWVPVNEKAFKQKPKKEPVLLDGQQGEEL